MDAASNSPNFIDFYTYVNDYYTTILTQMIVDNSITKN